MGEKVSPTVEWPTARLFAATVEPEYNCNVFVFLRSGPDVLRRTPHEARPLKLSSGINELFKLPPPRDIARPQFVRRFVLLPLVFQLPSSLPLPLNDDKRERYSKEEAR